MRIIWRISAQDVRRVRDLLSEQKHRCFVQNRIKMNVQRDRPKVTKPRLWFRLVSCLLTTQQRSGPDSAVTRFMNETPFPLSYATCMARTDLTGFSERTLRQFGGLRRWKRIAAEVTENLHQLEGGLWKETMCWVRRLEPGGDVATERAAAEFVVNHLAGFGPKQARNLLQSAGLTRYEIPLDSRITKWLNDLGFPVKLTAAGLSDANYYGFVLNGVQALCRTCRVYPCVLDAAIFASYDEHDWAQDDGII